VYTILHFKTNPEASDNGSETQSYASGDFKDSYGITDYNYFDDTDILTESTFGIIIGFWLIEIRLNY